MFLRLIGAYICLGVVVECIEELILIKYSEKWFGVESEIDGPFGIRGGYNMKFYLGQIKDILTWPIGILLLIAGVKILRQKSQEEIVQILDEADKKCRK